VYDYWYVRMNFNYLCDDYLWLYDCENYYGGELCVIYCLFDAIWLYEYWYDMNNFLYELFIYMN